MADEPHLGATYNEIHTLIGKAADKIREQFAPDMMVAIGGGGFFPARVMRTFLKDPKSMRNIPIQAIGLSLYESLPTTTAEQQGVEVVKTQWLGADMQALLGHKVLIVDEVDDSGRTLYYAISELKKDVEKALAKLPEEEREAKRPKFAVFVVHNKLKPKWEKLPDDILYFAGAEIPDIWFDYPWEMKDIYAHDATVLSSREAAEATKKS
ncbi:PRTase-like protein [Calocera viscosa TUFC12733]|uniref:PRTase-like protein n=1 Tax=Calocera viscosa (strain TUFC12733) TaxID=1330018 RepID=A0A167S990_CALVF|nr:PRTase-like protein [Calocera viscosa TUFC12733]